MKIQALLKPAFAAAIISCASFSAFAQGPYVKLGGGYNFGFGSAINYNTSSNTTFSDSGIPSSTRTYERVNVNLGKGSVLGGALGYMFNNNIGVEVGVHYLAGAKNTVKWEDNFDSNPVTMSPPTSYKETYTTKSQMVLVQPSLVIATSLPKFNPYARVGFIVAKGSLENTSSYSHSTGNTGETKNKYSGGTGFGLQAAFGLNFGLTDKVALFTEGTFNNLTYAPEKGEITKYTRNGTDLLPTLETSQKEFIFEDDHTVSFTEQPSPSEPGTGLKQRYVLHSIGLQAGIKYNF